ncbi:MAG: sensor histidine kinase, partial [Sedimentibacter sp.]|uniref:sensor histidine kinase n=1 Tax=Sedimentibacter sp. TaxID=1960295 RepID=UPI0029816B78
FFVAIIIMFSVGSIIGLSYFQMEDILNSQLETRLFNIAYYTAEDKQVKDALAENNNQELNLNEHIEKIRVKTNVDFIVVFDMNGIRLTHPNEENIGKKFRGGDEIRVLTTGEEYISKAVGTLGISIRAFSPIFQDGQQIGAVSVGSTVNEINKEKNEKMGQFIPFVIIGFLLGMYCAFVLSTIIKDEILGLEPKEITLMFKEKNAILENVKEGIITLNEKGNLIQYNKEAARILRLTDMDINRNINEFFLENDVFELLGTDKLTENLEVKIRPGVTILCKYNVLKNDKNQVIGQVVNFRDLTEIKKMAEELTGIKKMAWSLRAQNHEFMNKLHTISGLIQLEEYGEAIKYISKTAKRNEVTEVTTSKIKNASIEALLLAKYYKAEELRIKLEIDNQSILNKLPELLSEEDLGSLLGNLIENSFDAVNVDGTGKVFVKLSENDENLIIEIKDNGPGIPVEIREKIYEPRFTTKLGQRGYGMSIVKSIVDNANGEIILSVDNGTSWYIKIPMQGGENI